MKRKLFITASMIAVMALSAVGFAACGGGNEGGNESQSSVETPAENQVTVTYYDGTEELKSEKVDKGGKATEWTPEKEGWEFMGWFAEASLSQEFDFNTEITEDTDVFSAWRENVYVEDTAAWYFIGAGSGDMSASNWSHSTEGLFMTKDTSITDANVYTIEITMYAGDKFQITHSDSWDYQQGIGHMIGFEYAAGINPYAPDAGEVTAADRKYGEVRAEDGTLMFYGGDEYDKGAEVWNVWLADGQDGRYKFTYTTYPSNPAYNTIAWELIEKIEPQAETHRMYISGTMNEWSGKEILDSHKMTKSDDGSTWTIIYEVTEEDFADWTANEGPFGEKCAALKVKNEINGSDYGENGGATNIFLKVGTYAIKYNANDNSVAYEALDWYVVGTFLDADGNAVNYAVKADVTPKMEVVDGVASCTVELADVSANPNYSWIAAQGKTDKDGNAAQAAIKVVFGSEIAIQNWYGDGEDNYYLTAGTYTISIEIETGAITIVKA